ncbi:MAG: transposase [Clostridia bacterium]
MELPKRKSIRLKDYDYSQNGAYFVTICTQNRECLFGEIVGANLCVRPNNPHKIIEKYIIELKNKYNNIEIDKYIIMPNHIHFILSIHNKTGEHIGSPLHEMIKWFKTQTTNEYIHGVKNNLFLPFDKHIWQRGYYEHIIRNEKSYNEIWQYIDNNILSWEQDKLYHAK